MNSATTCSTGSRRCINELPCRHPGRCKASLRDPLPEETDQIWTEVGFLPPARCRRTVALLHRLAMDEEPAASLLSSVLVAVEPGDVGCGYRIFDPARLRRTAEEYGINLAGRSDTEVAHTVTLAIIAEYGEEHL